MCDPVFVCIHTKCLSNIVKANDDKFESLIFKNWNVKKTFLTNTRCPLDIMYVRMAAMNVQHVSLDKWDNPVVFLVRLLPWFNTISVMLSYAIHMIFTINTKLKQIKSFET